MIVLFRTRTKVYRTSSPYLLYQLSLESKLLAIISYHWAALAFQPRHLVYHLSNSATPLIANLQVAYFPAAH